MKKTKNKAPFHFPLADKLPSDPSRRALLKGAGIAGAVAVGASPTGAVLGAENQAEDVSNPLALEALETLTAAERRPDDLRTSRSSPLPLPGPFSR